MDYKGDVKVIKDYLKNNILITDGSMGTYYAEKTNDEESFCELDNVINPELIKEIHKEYIDAGAKLITTNTFSANTLTLEVNKQELKQVIENGYKIAKEAVGDRDVYIGASIGPIHESINGKDEDMDIFDEYKFIIDTFMDLGEDIFIFETFGSTDYLREVSKYIKERNSDAFILVGFAVTLNGYTRKEISTDRILKDVKTIDEIDSYGFNCALGPAHMYKIMKDLDIYDDIILALPNASYPERINEKMVYVYNPDYYANIVADIKCLGVKIVGGCCGTTPEHIKSIADRLDICDIKDSEKERMKKVKKIKQEKRKKTSNFLEKLKRNEFVIAVELDPPYDDSIEGMMESARVCKENGVDIVTVADSPRAIARVDSLVMAAKVKREIEIDVIPHLCCRDKNVNALKSGILAAHIEDIRNLLVITGDPILDIDKMSTKSVFNLNSYKLMELITDMNKEIFKNEPINIGGALNLNVNRKEVEIERMMKKVEKGANVFFTQPIYDKSAIDFLAKMKKNKDIKILGGIMPIVNYRNAQFLNNEVPGIKIPEKHIERFHPDMSKRESEQVGIELAVDIANDLKEYVDGFYFINPFNRIEMIMKILQRIEHN